MGCKGSDVRVISPRLTKNQRLAEMQAFGVFGAG